MDNRLDEKIKAILFDLDNTLIEIDLDKFIPHYLQLLAQSVAHIISPKKFISKILEASKAVEENNGRSANIDVYANAFFPIEGHTREEIEPFFDQFYKNDFSKLRQYTKKKPEARSVVQTAFDKGYDVIIATTPMLPATAIEQRLDWADVADFPYRLITTIENSNATKSLTHLLYYEQIIDKIGYPAHACLMIGDDEKDMIAARLGMQTFFIEDKVEDKDFSNHIPEPSYRGELADLKRIL